MLVILNQKPALITTFEDDVIKALAFKSCSNKLIRFFRYIFAGRKCDTVNAELT